MCENADNSWEKQQLESEKLDNYWKEYVAELKHHYARGDITLEDIVFLNLQGNPKWDWRSSSGIALESGMEREDVLKILERLVSKGTVVRNLNNDDHYGAVERVKDKYPHQFDVIQNFYADYYAKTTDPATFTTQQLVDKGVLAKPFVEINKSMFDGMNECLSEANKLISKAEDLNKQVLSFY